MGHQVVIVEHAMVMARKATQHEQSVEIYACSEWLFHSDRSMLCNNIAV